MRVFMHERDERTQERIALRFGRECADDIRDLLLDAEERCSAIGGCAQRSKDFELQLGRRFWKSWVRFRNAINF